MNILVTGAAGLVGTALTAHLTQNKHRVIRLVRKTQAAPGEIRWDPYAETIDAEALEGLDAVIHLAGENIATGRWTARKKFLIRESRIQGTRFLSQCLARLFDPPKVLVSVSAVGYYGDRGENSLDEESKPGKGFLADVCREWEAAAAPALMRGIRVVHPRLGMVLTTEGGALARMLPAFRLGVGGRIGSGRQYMSWISIDDLVGIIDFAIHDSSMHGPVNVVSPTPVTNQDFSLTLARVLSKPSFFTLPAFAARMVFGEMADALLLASARVLPARLKNSGYKFRFPELESALRHALK
ncbi:MAG TPA: TIGR01777 family oxidoreductase [Acidobacteriota bacterium]|nr:TIGR01777 family oxidoreductase [Acidobacteriota bacterium]